MFYTEFEEPTETPIIVACPEWFSDYAFVSVSTTEILVQLPTLTAAEREKIRAELDAIDSAAPISAEETRLIDERVAAYRQNPNSAVSWSIAEDEIRKRTGL